MSTRWPRTMFGVEIVYIRDHVARKVIALIPGGRAVWALLPDGRIGTNDTEFFRYAHAEGSRVHVNVAEKLWRLGKLKKSEYQKLAKARDKAEVRRSLRGDAADLKHKAGVLGLNLTKQQLAALNKLAA